MKFLLFSSLIFLKYYHHEHIPVSGYNVTCHYAQENSKAVLEFLWETSNKETAMIMISINDSEIANCIFKDMSCVKYLENIDCHIQNISSLVNKVKIGMLSNTTSGYWKIKYVQDTNKTDLNCKFRLYGDQDIILENCTKEVEEGTNVQCSCKFIGHESSNIVYSWHTYVGNVFISNASLLTFTAALNTTEYLCTVYIAHINSKISKVYSVNITEKPSIVFENCPSEVHIGDLVNCKCKFRNSITRDLLYSWYSTNGSNVFANTSEISFKVDLIYKGFICMVNWKQHTINKTYTLYIKELSRFEKLLTLKEALIIVSSVCIGSIGASVVIIVLIFKFRGINNAKRVLKQRNTTDIIYQQEEFDNIDVYLISDDAKLRYHNSRTDGTFMGNVSNFHSSNTLSNDRNRSSMHQMAVAKQYNNRNFTPCVSIHGEQLNPGIMNPIYDIIC